MTKVYTNQKKPINMNNNKITSLGTPTYDYDAATKKYVDNAVDENGGDNLGNHIATQDLNLNGYDIYGAYQIITDNDISCGDDLYVDDEGLLTANEDSVWFQVPWFPEPLVGSGLILGLNRETGESEDCNHNADFYRDQVRFFKNA